MDLYSFIRLRKLHGVHREVLTTTKKRTERVSSMRRSGEDSGLENLKFHSQKMLASLYFFSQILAVDHPSLAVQSLGLTVTPQDISQDRRNNKEHHVYLYDIFVYIFMGYDGSLLSQHVKKYALGEHECLISLKMNFHILTGRRLSGPEHSTT